MEAVKKYFASSGLDIERFITAGIMLVGVSLILALISRMIFGKKSALCRSVSSAIGILFIYAITIVLCSSGSQFQKFISPLPFITIENDMMILFSFDQDYTIICSEVLGMIILAFIMNLADSWLPVGKRIVTWVLFRCVGVALAIILHLIVTKLLTSALPEGLITYAPTILLAVLALMLLTGALRFLVGILLTAVNPLIAAFYTFFFANAVGKQVTRAVLTTVILTALVFLLQKVGIVAISIASATLVAYIPLIIILAGLWFVISKFL